MATVSRPSALTGDHTSQAQVTPATDLHSHHNRGTKRMRSAVIQDEGLHYCTRTPGFSWD